MLLMTSKPGSKAWVDRLHHQSGRAYRAVGSPKKTMAATSIRKTRYYQIAGGDPTGAPEHLVRTLDGLARTQGLNPYALLAFCHVVVEEARAEAVPTHELVRALRTDLREEMEHELGEDLASFDLIGALNAGSRVELIDALRNYCEQAESEIAVQLNAIGKARVLMRSIEAEEVA